MKLREIFRFELAYQLRRPWPWIAFAVLLVFAFENTRVGIVPVTLPQDFILNSPFIIACVTVISCLIWLLVASPIAGEAAARDIETGINPLTYTTHVRKFEYLGGHFLAAFFLNALVLLGVQAGSILVIYAGGIHPEIIGPFRPAAYLAAYAFIALPNAFTATSIQFAVALFSGRSFASYAGSVAIFFFTVPVPVFIYFALGQPEIALLLDPIGMFAIMNEMMTEWTIVEKNVRMFTLDGPMLLNRLLWFGISIVTLVFIHQRFRRAHRAENSLWTRFARLFSRRKAATITAKAPKLEGNTFARSAISLPQVSQSFGFGTHLRQTLSTAWSSFRMIITSLPGVFLLVIFPLFAVLVLFAQLEHWGISLLPQTGYILSKYLTAPLTHFSDFRVMVPLLIVYLTGQLVWRERDAQISENIDVTPVPEWVLFIGKFLGLGLVLSVLMVSISLAGILTQTLMGYYDFQIDLYLQILFGFQLPVYLLFSVLTFFIHVVINHKHVSMLAALVAYICVAFSSYLGIEHNLLVYGSGPDWFFTDIRGFGSSVGPWLWFKFYWAAWALLLGLAVRLFWVRGRESGFQTRLQIAQGRFNSMTAGVAVMAVTLILILGGFIFYNTNILNDYMPQDEVEQRRAEYEKLYGKYEGAQQPQRTATNLEIEIYPDQRTATVHGNYHLVNATEAPIDSVHLEPAFNLETSITFDRAVHHVVADDELGHHIYALNKSLYPGDSLKVSFEVKFEPHGFSNSGLNSSGAGQAIVENGTYFTSSALPAIGYQPQRELMSAEDRRNHGLPRKVTLAPPGDIDPNVVTGNVETFKATIGTTGDQVAVAPGELRSTWSESGRRYFHYASDVPIKGMEVFFSADYLVHREQWKGIDIQAYVHPNHKKHLARLIRSVRESLDYYSEQFGRYPYSYLQIVEQPGNFMGMGVDGSGVITGGEGFFLLDPKNNGFDAIFEIVAHEMGHQWWGMQVTPAFAEGGGVISESLAWYSAMQLVKNVKGKESLRQFMSLMRQPNPWPPINTGLPLLRAMDPWSNYRKGPYAMYALSEYIGEDRVNGALKSFVKDKGSSLATTLDLYRELQVVTPDSLKSLLHDLFEVNTSWTFDTKQATAQQTEAGTWQVTFEVETRKVVVDSAGVVSEVPMSVPVEIGIFDAAKPAEILGEPLYVKKHDVHLGTQTISIEVSQKPARGGIDPYNLLDWKEGDNIEAINVENQHDEQMVKEIIP